MSTITLPPPPHLSPAQAGAGENQERLLEISMGPQHPSTHGVFRMNVVLDGERVVRLKPVFGYLHRNHEKIAESETYLARSPTTGPTPSPSRSSPASPSPSALNIFVSSPPNSRGC
jgi:NADH-quinone oxidoreductase subunit D